MARRDSALVTNASDPKQVQFARRSERNREAMFVAALRAVMHTPEGRLVFAEVLERGRLYASVYDHSGSTMYFNEGRRNFALEISADLVRASESQFELMEREARARARAVNEQASTIQATDPRKEE
jgi:hypothetical protein